MISNNKQGRKIKLTATTTTKLTTTITTTTITNLMGCETIKINLVFLHSLGAPPSVSKY